MFFLPALEKTSKDKFDHLTSIMVMVANFHNDLDSPSAKFQCIFCDICARRAERWLYLHPHSLWYIFDSQYAHCFQHSLNQILLCLRTWDLFYSIHFLSPLQFSLPTPIKPKKKTNIKMTRISSVCISINPLVWKECNWGKN